MTYAPSSDDEHPPREGGLRVARGQYEPAFLEMLEANGQVQRVGEDWSGDVAGLPAQVTHVLHPNGDLERIGMA